MSFNHSSGAEVFTIDEFIEACRENYFNDDDGSAYYGNKKNELNVSVNCSDAEQGLVSRNYTHVWWYNK